MRFLLGVFRGRQPAPLNALLHYIRAAVALLGNPGRKASFFKCLSIEKKGISKILSDFVFPFFSTALHFELQAFREGSTKHRGWMTMNHPSK